MTDAKAQETAPEKAQDKVPVTVLTGYLGAGKTTLLNRSCPSRTARNTP